MNTTLIEPPRYYSPSSPISTVVIPPLGPAYIAAALEAAGHTVEVIDALEKGITSYRPYRSVYLRGLTIDQICDRIPSHTRLIGISCMFSAQWLIVRELIGKIKKFFPHVPIVLGGEHGTGMPELTMKQAPLDFIVLGEGEETVVDLTYRLERGLPVENIEGTAVRIPDGGWKINPRRKRIRTIDEIPWPAWHLFNVDAYIEFNQPHGASRGRFIPMLASRGCPFQCTFCTSAQMWTTRWVARNPAQVVDEMERYMARYRVTDFHFEDLTAIVRRDWIIKFCQIIIERGLNITFQLPSGTRSEAVDGETSLFMKRAGCHEFSFAPESGDPRVLKAIKKQVNLDHLFCFGPCRHARQNQCGRIFYCGFPGGYVWKYFSNHVDHRQMRDLRIFEHQRKSLFSPTQYGLV